MDERTAFSDRLHLYDFISCKDRTVYIIMGPEQTSVNFVNFKLQKSQAGVIYIN